ncbi:fungal-specific transcription factor domain-containing protein [Dipodascopsis uninucleata]
MPKANSDGNSRPKQQRVRTGCRTCRSRHRKCDEARPSCNNCKSRNLRCIWNATIFFVENQSSWGVSSSHRIRSIPSAPMESIQIVDETASLAEKNALSSSVGQNSQQMKDGSEYRNVADGDAALVLLSLERDKELNMENENGGVREGSHSRHVERPASSRQNYSRDTSALPSNSSVSPDPDLTQQRSSIIRETENTSLTSLSEHSLQTAENAASIISVSSATSNYSSASSKSMEGNNVPENKATAGSLGPQYHRVHRYSSPLSHSILDKQEPIMMERSPTGGLPAIQSPEDVLISSVSPQDYLTAFDSIDQLSETSFGYFTKYHNLHNTLRDYMLSTARTLTPFNARSPANDREEQSNREASAPLSVEHAGTFIKEIQPLTEKETTRILKNYLDEVAGWLDMFDKERKFATEIVSLSMNCPALFYSLLAISARQLERVDHNCPSSMSLELYQQSISYILPSVETHDIKIIAACVILCCLEMMSSSPQNWRRHLEGCAAMFYSAGINGFCGGLGQALFWCFARMDISSAVIGDESTIILSNDWLAAGMDVQEAGVYFRNSESPDMYANYAVFLCSRVLNLISAIEIHDTTLNYDQNWEDLWKELCEWEQMRPIEMKPLLSYEPAKDAPFPTVLYANAPAISGNQLYHMASILLMQHRPRRYNFQKHHHSMLWHAKQVCAISITNTHHGCWNNALQPLWVAGKLMSHHSEHDAILELLRQIEKTTGWAMRWRGEDLKEIWKNG